MENTSENLSISNDAVNTNTQAVSNDAVNTNTQAVEDVPTDLHRYTQIDCLSEDAPISGQRFVLLSFISPETIMNCKIRGLKVRGVYDDLARAQKAAQKLRDIDRDHHIFVGEVGKWMPWDPTEKQVEEEKYEDEKLDKIMKKAHESEMKMNDLNELVGRHKEKLETKGNEHEDRVRGSIKQAAEENRNAVKEQIKADAAATTATESGKTPENTENTGNTKKESKNKFHGLNRDREAIKERLLKKIEENKQKKQNMTPSAAAASQNYKQSLEEKNKKLREESIRVVEKEHNVESLKADKEKIEANLAKMKEIYKESQMPNGI